MKRLIVIVALILAACAAPVQEDGKLPVTATHQYTVELPFLVYEFQTDNADCVAIRRGNHGGGLSCQWGRSGR